MLRLGFSILHILVILFLPFIILIRGAVYFHQYHQLYPTLAIISGALLCSLLLLIYVNYLFTRLGPNSTFSLSFSTKMKLVMTLVIIFCIHGIFFLRSDNLKNPSLKNNLHKLHPIIRLAVSTVIFLDKELIVTDGLRVAEDYRRMGLPSNTTSLHYQQKDGYAYAVDIRTNDRSMVRNTLMKVYFNLMGFRSLRHSGSDDHLHISLYCPFLPRSF